MISIVLNINLYNCVQHNLTYVTLAVIILFLMKSNLIIFQFSSFPTFFYIYLHYHAYNHRPINY